MARIIAITNQKGGVGKTTTAVSLASGLKLLGKSTLLIDTDNQCNSTDTYRAKTDGVATLFDLLFTNEPAENCVQHTESGDIVACDRLLKDAEQRFPNDASRSYLLKEKCSSFNDKYDFIIIDTPPTMGVILANVFTYAHEIIIPVTSDRYGLAGIDLLAETLESCKKYTNPDISVLGMLMIKYAERMTLDRTIREGLPSVAEKFHSKVFNTRIRESVACRKSQASRMTIYDFEKNSTTAVDYMDFCDEVLNY